MKLLPKISLILISGIGSALLVAGILDFYYTRAAWERSISSQQVELGTKVMDEIDSFLYERYLDIQAIGEDSIFEKLAEGGQVASSELKDHISDIATFSGPWDTLFLINVDGVIIASTLDEKVGNMIEEEPNNYEIFKRLNASKNEVLYTDLVISDDTGKPVVIFAVSVRDRHASGQPVVGVVTGGLAWQAVQDILQNIETDTELNLYTKDGKLIATNQESPENLLVIEEEVLPLIQNALKEGYPITNVGTDIEDIYEEELRAVVPSSGHLGYKGNDWVLLAEEPVESVFAPAREQATRAALLLIFGFLVALGATMLFFSRLVISNITLLMTAAKAISGGDLSQRVNIQSNDEIGELTEAFNHMASRLQEYYGVLEQKVKERTVETEGARKQLEVVNLEMQKKLKEMERMNDFMVGRELRMKELKKENEELKKKIASGNSSG
ncbi:MAG: Two-component sensor kinase [Parcubacteria group bacterium GW2011_GWC1_45_9]|nr:MAG: Two-component sensor kinase [Parcubacteria group bacterium GW2011_GWA1_Parcubacteria_45_10]KKT89164.1 MAG: Two-component sensor kinase [Parcubacteria group bacterium GW2011_GWB1_45_10]KKU17359.1 MAG: Two-component sensor kinase [Parcubacteria group bacterium GW2011_GWC1_45_9]HCI05702.1 hypothetical protein [Patescibacteria group bacterium]